MSHVGQVPGDQARVLSAGPGWAAQCLLPGPTVPSRVLRPWPSVRGCDAVPRATEGEARVTPVFSVPPGAAPRPGAWAARLARDAAAATLAGRRRGHGDAAVLPAPDAAPAAAPAAADAADASGGGPGSPPPPCPSPAGAQGGFTGAVGASHAVAVACWRRGRREGDRRWLPWSALSEACWLAGCVHAPGTAPKRVHEPRPHPTPAAPVVGGAAPAHSRL